MFGFLLFLGAWIAFIVAMFTYDEPPAASRPTSPPMLVHYRTRDGLAFYSFSIEERSGGRYRSYIVGQPDYGSRATDAHSTHRHWDASGRAYVCWSRPITSEQDALRVSAAWADATQEYIKSGQRF
jgi:hypothetical protein